MRDTELGHIFSLEHPATITIGRNSSENDLLLGQQEYLDQNIIIVQTDRGGELTAHEPGQLVIYPILNVSKLGFGAKSTSSYF